MRKSFAEYLSISNLLGIQLKQCQLADFECEEYTMGVEKLQNKSDNK